MSFRLWTIFYVFALVAAALATFGAWGIGAAAVVFGFWLIVFSDSKTAVVLLKYLIVIFIVCSGIELLLPSINPGRRFISKRNQCMTTEKQIILAILSYEVANGTQPPAYVADANGIPMHSWRVLILPFIEEIELYRKYNFDEPWNGPNNSKLAAQIPEIYQCPSQRAAKSTGATETNYLAVVDPETGWPGSVGRRITDFPDGTSKTIMIVEATGMGVNWMEPRDLSFDEAIELMTTKANSGHRHVEDGFLTTKHYGSSIRNMAYCDGRVGYLGQFEDASVPRALLTVAGGESIPSELGDEFRPAEVKTVVKWGKVYALSVFVILALLPAAWFKRGETATFANEKEPKNSIVSTGA